MYAVNVCGVMDTQACCSYMDISPGHKLLPSQFAYNSIPMVHVYAHTPTHTYLDNRTVCTKLCMHQTMYAAILVYVHNDYGHSIVMQHFVGHKYSR